ncbi:unnamed protein product [Heligmosomoides polygyrus]|uniref:Protein-tyrosine phosphatase n=1 Tax=Heligmosomoides polygyrus TaxID=6339 RepID=A0A183FI05_HELPZ|nr:unnamed protein product [Heligmosomoides polygyrus]
MTTKAKQRGRTVRQRRRIFETYEEPDDAPPAQQGAAHSPPALPKRPPTFIRRAPPALHPEVEKAIDKFIETYTTIGVEGLRKQFREELATYRPPDHLYKFKAFEMHPDKNRYMDVVCLDHSRVCLTLNVPPCTDYIHANRVKFEGHDKVFIATQAPLDNTIEDFWRMIFQEGVPHVLNLTKIVEDGKIKSTQYWPLEAGQYHNFGKMFVNTKKVETEGKLLVYTVEVLPDGFSNSNIVKIVHVTTWPDRGLPMSGRHVLRVIRQVSGHKNDNGPIVMHCSAGIGRTGVIILIDMEGQYAFTVLSVLDYIRIRCPKYKDRVNKFVEEFRTAMMES